MGWEKRGNNIYYYKKRRIGKTVVSEYVGRGEGVREIELLDVMDRNERKKEREKTKKEKEVNNQVQCYLNDTFKETNLLLNLTLLLSGYHTHKGEWRKRRNE